MEQDFAEVLNRYEPAVQRLAHRLRPESKVLDSAANDRFDYVSLLRSKAVVSQTKYHEKERTAPEHSFVLASLWNNAAACATKAKRLSRIQFEQLADEMSEHYPDDLVDERDIEAEVAAREAVAGLRAALSIRDMQILEAWAAHDGNYRETSRLMGPKRSGCREQKIKQIVLKARGILEGMSVLGPETVDRESIQVERHNMREQLERQANGLGIPFTNDTSDAELRSMIETRESDATTDFDRRARETADSTGGEVPECFGIMWAADSEPQCGTCKVNQFCLGKMALHEIPDRTLQAGRPMSPDELAESLGIPVKSVMVALSYQQNKGQLQKSEPQPDPAGPPAPVDSTPSQEPVATQEESVTTQKSKPKAAKPKASKKSKTNGKLPHDEATALMSAQDPQSAGSASPVADPVVAPKAGTATPAAVQAPLKSQRKSGPSGKVKPAGKKAKPKNASSTSSRQSRKAPPKKVAAKASSRKAPPKRVSTKGKVPPSPRRPEGQEPWGEHTYQARWERERARSAAIASVPVGSKIAREYNGDRLEAQCRQGHWLFQGEKYPTLYSVTLKITGGEEYQVRQNGKPKRGKTRVMSNWSAPRFWKLAER